MYLLQRCTLGESNVTANSSTPPSNSGPPPHLATEVHKLAAHQQSRSALAPLRASQKRARRAQTGERGSVVEDVAARS